MSRANSTKRELFPKWKQFAKQYAADGITPQEIEAVIKQLEAYSAADLYESNKAIMKLVADGFLLKREDRSQKDLYIQLIDFLDLGSDTDIRKAL